MLDEFITVNRIEIVTRCRAKVATRSDPPPTIAEIDHGVPMFLDQLLDELRRGPSVDGDIAQTAARHGSELFVQGYTVAQVVHDYGDVCQAVTELAIERHAAISAEDFRTLNRCLDDAIASAVTEYGRDRSSARDSANPDVQRETDLHDLVQAIHTSKSALEAIRSGNVGADGNTGTVLTVSLHTASDLAERLLSEVLGTDRAA